MFKKFSPSSDVSSQSALKSSAQRAIRGDLASQWKGLDPETLDLIWPKKEPLVHAKARDHPSIYTVGGVPIFFQHFDGPFVPTLRLVHQYPHILPQLQVDRGAIRFLLAGANMMCPGFTSAGGRLPSKEDALEAGTVVTLMAEGKVHPAGIGILKMSTEEMKKVNKGVGVEVQCILGDDLWKIVDTLV